MIDTLVLADGLDRASVGRIVTSLLPRTKVDENTAVKVVACLGLGSERAPLQTQVVLLVSALRLGIPSSLAGHDIPLLDIARDPPTIIWRDL